MEANASFEKQKVASYAHAYEGKIIFLFDMGFTHNNTAFFIVNVTVKFCLFTYTNSWSIPLLVRESEKCHDRVFVQPMQTQ